MNDTDIINLYLSRKESAISETEKQYGPYLQKCVYNILRSYEDSEEVVSDVYLAAWNAIPPAVPRGLKHFLSRITRNLAFDRLDYLTAKRRDPHMSLLLSELDACLPDPKSSLEASLDRKHTGCVLNQFLSGLDTTDCAVFLCRYYYCMTISQISIKYNLPERHVKYRLSLLRQKLRKQLEMEGIYL